MAAGYGELHTLGGFIHILLVLAIAVVLIRVIQGRNPV
ncbi:MAG: lmo0937 family membrane protein [Vicinamibacterales bacterium]